MAVHRGYVGAKRCTNGPTEGARGLMSWFMAAYADDGGLNAGIYNCRPIRGSVFTTSLHGEGRAADLAIRPYAARYGTELAEELRLNSRELGIQCIIWNERIWSGGSEHTGWRPYSGYSKHKDHLHVELTWEAARRPREDMVDLLQALMFTDDPVLVPVKVVKPKPKPSAEPNQSWNHQPDGSKNFPPNYDELVVDGRFKALTIGALQILLHECGYTNNQLWDGRFDKRTITDSMKMLQKNRYYKVTAYARGRVPRGTKLSVDGVAGHWFWYEFQRFLRDRKLYRGKLDGKPLQMTYEAVQKYLNQQNNYLEA